MSISAARNEDAGQDGGFEEFITSGRTGRRNALSDVMETKLVEVSTAGLANAFEGVDVKGKWLIV